MLENAQGGYVTIVSPTLAGGTIIANGGVTALFPSFGLKGTVTVSGSAASRIAAGSGPFAAVNIGPTDTTGTLTLSVADVTASSATDLLVEVPLQDNQNAAVTSPMFNTLAKTGPGTLTLVSSNTYSGGTQLLGGTLQVGDGGTTGSIVGDVATSAGATLVLNRSDTHLFAGNVAGGGSLVVSGTGTAVFTGALSHTGGTTLTSSMLRIGNGGGSGSLAGPVSGTNSALVFDRTGDSTLPGSISGSMTLTKLGPGMLTLGASNSHSGANFVAAGTLVPSVAGGLGSGPITFGGGTLQYSASNSADYSSRIANSTGPVAIHTAGQTVTFAQSLPASNTAGLSKTGPGVLRLTTSNSYTGPTTVLGGTLELSARNAVPAASSLLISGGTVRLTASNVFGPREATSTLPVTVTAGGTLASASTSTVLANLTLAGGTLLSDGGTFSEPIGVAFKLKYTLTATGSTPSFVSTAGGFLNGIAVGPSNASGNLTLDVADVTADAATDLTIDTPLSSAILDGTGGTGLNNGITKTGPGTLLLARANTYVGPTVLAAGVTRVTDPSAVPSFSGLWFTGGTLEFPTSLNSGSLFSSLASGSSSAPARVDTVANTVVWTGTGLPTANLPNGFVKLGTGLLSFPGVLNGPLTIDAGTFRMTSNRTVDPLVGNVTNNGALVFALTNGGFTANFDGTLSGTGSVTIESGTSFNFRSATTYTGPTLVNGELRLSSGGQISDASSITVNGLLRFLRSDAFGPHTTTSSPAITVNPAGTLRVESGRFNTLVDLTLVGGLVDLRGGSSAEFPALGLKGTLTVTAPSTISAVGASAFAAVNIGPSDAPGSLVVNNSDTLTVAVPLQNQRDATSTAALASGLIKTGVGVLDLQTANTFTGPLTVNQGAVYLSGGGSTSPLSTITLNPGASLRLERPGVWGDSDDLLSTPVLNVNSGSTLFVNAGPNTLTRLTLSSGLSLAAPLSLKGTVTVNGNASIFSSGGDPRVLVGLSNSAAATTFAGNAPLTISVPLQDNFPGSSLVKTGWGTLTLNNPSTYTGGTTFAGGVLTANDAGSIGTTGPLTFTGGTLRYGNHATDFSPRIVNSTGPVAIDTNLNLVFATPLAASNTGGLTKLGDGALVLAGAQLYSGTTSVTGGTLEIIGTVHNTSAVHVVNANLRLAGTNALGARGSTQPPVSLATAALNLAAPVTVGALTLSDSDVSFLPAAAVNPFDFAIKGPIVENSSVMGFSSNLGFGGSISSVAVGPVDAPGVLTVDVVNSFGQLDVWVNLRDARSADGLTDLPTGLTKSGPGFLLFNTPFSLGGTVTVTGGTVLLVRDTVNQPALHYSAAAIDVSNATVTLDSPDTFGPLSVTSTPVVTVRPGGTVRSDAALNTLVSPVLAGGTLSGPFSSSALVPGLILKGTVSVTGSATSALGFSASDFTAIGSTSGPGSTTFDVADVTSSSAPDLQINTVLVDAVAETNPAAAHPSTLVKSGPGTLVLVRNAAHTGGTRVLGGVLQLGSNTSSGTVPGNISTAAGGSVVFNLSSTITYPGVVSGDGSLTQRGPGRITLSAPQT